MRGVMRDANGTVLNFVLYGENSLTGLVIL